MPSSAGPAIFAVGTLIVLLLDRLARARDEPRLRRRRQRLADEDDAHRLRPALRGLRPRLQRPVPRRRRGAARRAATRRRCTKLAGALRAEDGVAAVSPPRLNPAGDTATLDAVPDEQAAGPGHAGPARRSLRDDVVPPVAKAERPAGQHRRRDGDAGRPQRRAVGEAARVRAGRRRPVAAAAGDRLPLGPDPAEGRVPQRAQHRRRARRHHLGLPGRAPRLADRRRHHRADRVVLPRLPVRDRVRALDGLRGVPRHAHARGVGAARRTRATRCATGSR